MVKKMKSTEGSVPEENNESFQESEMEMLDCQMAKEFPRPGKIVNMNSKEQSVKVHKIMPDSKIKRTA